MNLLLVAATPFEIAPVLRFLDNGFSQSEPGTYQNNELQITPLITGAGCVATAWRLALRLSSAPFDWALNAGVAGAFDRSLALGDVVQVVTEQFGDLGVEDAAGGFTDLFQLGLADPNTPPFLHGKLYNPAAGQASFLPTAHGLTVSRVHGSNSSIEAAKRGFPDVQVESMEGAAFFYGCLSANIPFAEIRSISNYVEPRNRANWQLETAIENLNQVLLEIIESLVASRKSFTPLSP